jgi:hypothetical protein
MPNTILTLNSKKPLELQTRRGKDALRRVANRINAILSGNEADADWTLANSEASTDAPVRRAGAFWVSSSGSGSMTATIAGTAIAVTYTTSDSNTGALMKAAINANAVAVVPIISAHRRVAKMTLASVVAGDTLNVFGNKFTFGVVEQTATITCASVADGDTVTFDSDTWTAENGSPGTGEFDMSLATDALVAADLARCINVDTATTGVSATAAGAVVTVRRVAGGVLSLASDLQSLLTSSDAATLTVADFTPLIPAGDRRRETAVDVQSSDTECANALCDAINTHPRLSANCFAANVAGVVYLALRQDRAATSGETLLSGATTITINNQITEGAVVAIQAHQPGVLGNYITLTASGTGASVVTENSGKLGGGAGYDTLAEIVASSYR